MFAEHLHDSAIGRQLPTVRIFGKVISDPELLADCIDVIQLVRSVFVRTEDPEVLYVQLHDIPKKRAQRSGVLSFRRPRLFYLEGIFVEVRKAQSLLQSPSVSVRVGPHAACTSRRKFSEFTNEPSRLIEELFRFVRAHPGL